MFSCVPACFKAFRVAACCVPSWRGHIWAGPQSPTSVPLHFHEGKHGEKAVKSGLSEHCPHAADDVLRMNSKVWASFPECRVTGCVDRLSVSEAGIDGAGAETLEKTFSGRN